MVGNTVLILVTIGAVAGDVEDFVVCTIEIFTFLSITSLQLINIIYLIRQLIELI